MLLASGLVRNMSMGMMVISNGLRNCWEQINAYSRYSRRYFYRLAKYLGMKSVRVAAIRNTRNAIFKRLIKFAERCRQKYLQRPCSVQRNPRQRRRLIKNSWVTDWGSNGFGWVAYDSNQIVYNAQNRS